MGYETRYELDWTPTTWIAKPLCEHPKSSSAKFCETCGKPNAVADLNVIVGDYIEKRDEISFLLNRTGRPANSGKWYEYQEYLAEMSSQIPGVLFHLSGEGRDAGDIWDAWALNGKVERVMAKIIRAEVPACFRKTSDGDTRPDTIK